MHVPVATFQRALDMYVAVAYPQGLPAALAERLEPLRKLGGGELSLELLEKSATEASWALRLGQPLYPHMKLVIDPVPGNGASCRGEDFLLRVDAHDRHLHAPAGSPDAAWLATIRASNKAIGEKIEADWAAAGLPTFKEYLRMQLEARRRASAEFKVQHSE